jgi:hypothetical protein
MIGQLYNPWWIFVALGFCAGVISGARPTDAVRKRRYRRTQGAIRRRIWKSKDIHQKESADLHLCENNKEKEG